MPEPLISVASFAYPRVAGTRRAELASAIREVDDAFVLSTCLRIEIAVPGDVRRLRTTLGELFGDVDDAEVSTGADALHHLYRVAAGLESPVLGEPEILTQYRAAVADGKARWDGRFIKLLEQGVATGRSARALLPFNPHESMAAVAAQVVGHVDRVTVFGAGVMGAAIVTALSRMPSPPAITVAVRSPERVTFEGVEVVGIGEADTLLASEPAVISATSAKTRLVDGDRLGEILRRRSAPLTLVDMAMPPDFEPPGGAAVTYVDIDALAGMASRRRRSHAADDHVRDAAFEIHRQVGSLGDVGPVIRHMIERADDIVERTVDRFATRLADPRDEAILRQAVHTAARTVLADPVAFVRDAEADSVDALAEAFGFDD